MPVSKRTRFEVLRRDNYTCRYCRSTEDALTVDHVTPVALGGNDAPENLVACCKDCNAGKTSTSPDEGTLTMLTDAQIAYERARATVVAREQAKARKRQSMLNKFHKAWEASTPRGAELPADWRTGVAKWVSRGLSVNQVIEAAEIAGGKTHFPPRQTYAYMAKICWNWVTELEDAIHDESVAEAENSETEATKAEIDAYQHGWAAGEQHRDGELFRQYHSIVGGGQILQFHIDGMSDRIPLALRHPDIDALLTPPPGWAEGVSA